jgi:uncharacterized membrane protein
MSMFLFDGMMFLHILAAVIGLGAAFVFPVLSRAAKTAEQARHTIALFEKLALLPIAGSVGMLITGASLLLLEPALLATGWFIASLFLFFAAQMLVIGVLLKSMRRQSAALEAHDGEGVPVEYRRISRQTARVEMVTHLLAVVLLAVLIFRPF